MEKQKMRINRKVMQKEKEFEVRADIIVPDIKPDMVAIKSTNANVYIRKEEITRGKLRLDGNVDGYVTYLSESGESRSLEITLDFIENVEDDGIEEAFKARDKVNLKNIEAKILNERKLSVTATMGITAEFFEKKEFEFIKSVEDEKIQIREENFKIKKIVGEGKGSSVVREGIETENQTSISEISRVDLEIANVENKVSFNKVLSKADLNLKITYQTEELKEESITASYPITSFIDMENAKEDSVCESDFIIRNMLFKVDSVISSKLTFEVDIDINLEMYEQEEISVIQDMYGLDKEIELKKSDVAMCVDGEEKKISFIEEIEEKDLEKKNEYSMVVYFVKPHDTVWKIAKMFKVTMDSIIQANNLENPDRINVGEKLYIVK